MKRNSGAVLFLLLLLGGILFILLWNNWILEDNSDLMPTAVFIGEPAVTAADNYHIQKAMYDKEIYDQDIKKARSIFRTTNYYADIMKTMELQSIIPCFDMFTSMDVLPNKDKIYTVVFTVSYTFNQESLAELPGFMSTFNVDIIRGRVMEKGDTLDIDSKYAQHQPEYLQLLKVRQNNWQYAVPVNNAMCKRWDERYLWKYVG